MNGEPQKVPRTLEEAFGPGARLDTDNEPDIFTPAAVLVFLVLLGLVIWTAIS